MILSECSGGQKTNDEETDEEDEDGGEVLSTCAADSQDYSPNEEARYVHGFLLLSRSRAIEILATKSRENSSKEVTQQISTKM